MEGVIGGNIIYENEKINENIFHLIQHIEPTSYKLAICAVKSCCSTIDWLEIIQALFKLFYFPIVFSLPPSAQIQTRFHVTHGRPSLLGVLTSPRRTFISSDLSGSIVVVRFVLV